MNRIVQIALAARTEKDIDVLETSLRAAGARRYRFLGDKEANWSTLSNAAEPKALLFERDLNMFDGILEREVQRQHPDVARLTSPAEAARIVGLVPKGGIAEMTETERADLGRQAVVTLYDSDESRRRPSIAFRDSGIGISRREAPYTVLSLEGSNKLSKPYLHGVFGKGGSLACMFSVATVFVLRKQPDLLAPGEQDEVTVVAVRREDSPEVRLPFFRYLVCDVVEDPKGQPWACPGREAPDFAPGVYVAHIGYQADKMGQQNWNQDESIYAYAETLLLRPTLPFGLDDQRTPPANRRPEGRRAVSILSGLGLRLDRLEVQGDARATLLRRSGYSSLSVQGVGTALVRWWLFRDKDKRRQYVAHGYVTVLTHDGQVNHAWDQQRFVTLVPTRRRVAERIFVEVNLEGIPRKQRIQILSSIRDALRKTPEARKLEEAIAAWLNNDPDLEEAETRFVREALQKSAQKMTRDFLDRLNRAIATKIPSLGVLLTKKGTQPRPRPPKPREDLHPEPTTFYGPASLSILPGETRHFFMTINAVDGFVPVLGTIELREVPATADLTLAVGDLRRGRIQLSLSASDETAPGTHRGMLALGWLRAAGGIAELCWPLEIAVLAERPDAERQEVKRRDGAGQKAGRKKSIIALVWNKLEDQKDSGWSAETAGDLQQMSGAALADYDPELYGDLREVAAEVPTIVLNEDFALWQAYHRGAAARGDQALKLRCDRYAIAIGTAIANLWVQEDAIGRQRAAWEANGNGADEPPKSMDPDQRRRAISQAARGTLVVLPDFDKMAAEFEEIPALAR